MNMGILAILVILREWVVNISSGLVLKGRKTCLYQDQSWNRLGTAFKTELGPDHLDLNADPKFRQFSGDQPQVNFYKHNSHNCPDIVVWTQNLPLINQNIN